MSSMLAPEPTREVICPGCGRVRVLSGRHARRVPATCNLCRGPKRGKPGQSDYRFWLKLFSDEEIARIAGAIFGGEGDAACVHGFRERLLDESMEDVMDALLGKAKVAA